MKTASKIISSVFHPLIMPVMGLLIIFNTDSYLNYVIPSVLKNSIIVLVGGCTFIFPLLLALILVNRKVINSLEMETQKERNIPYAITIIFFILTLTLLKKAPVPPIIYNFIIGATLSVMLAFIINMKWKISAHMIGIGGLVGALLCVASLLEVYLLPQIVCTLLIAGLIGSSRLQLKAHSPSQIYIGFLVGVFCQFIILYL
jgi:membrane-associated phospholipid phosphatase